MLPNPLDALSWLALQVLPLRCLVCSNPGNDGLDLCAACHAELPWNDHACPLCALPLPPGDPVGACGACLREPPRQVGAAATFLYAPPIDRLVLRFKFHQDLAAGRLLAQLMLQAVPVFATAPLLPMPLHGRRLRERGYDQARELTRPLARELGLPLWSGLCRSRATVAQSTLDADARRQNLRGAFAVQATPPPRLTLVDDVMTTGATLDAAVRALRRSGLQEATLWVCARAP
ncbi:ComF family protein [Stenotrophomonas sp. PD6]|uniref:ComF family protein n=1 Tax=Stenotrophomonas sp. PD6 TaxID=3368612 RepID=UPI003BA19D8A